MPGNTFAIRITIDGKPARQEAGKLRQVLLGAMTFEFDKSGKIVTRLQAAESEAGRLRRQFDAAGGASGELARRLRRAEREAKRLRKRAEETAQGYKTAGSAAALFVRDLSRARLEQQGVHSLLGDIQGIGRSMQFAGTALTGSLALAGRSYLELATETDRASRSLMLNRDLTNELRREVIDLAGDLALLDPQAMAEGITIWAQATGQAVESSNDLRRVLEQTIPVQQLAAGYPRQVFANSGQNHKQYKACAA